MTYSINYLYADDSPTYSEQSADKVIIFEETGDHVATLYRYEGRWTDTEDVTGDTVLWRDVDTFLDSVYVPYSRATLPVVTDGHES